MKSHLSITKAVSVAIIYAAASASCALATFQQQQHPRQLAQAQRYIPAFSGDRSQAGALKSLTTVQLGYQDIVEESQSKFQLNSFSRRDATKRLAQLATAACFGLPSLVSGSRTNTIANAVVMSNDSAEATVFKAGEALGPERARGRFVKAKESLQYLLDHYDEIVAQGGGDNVRRYLGTVGVSSGLYGIPKVLKELQEEAKDVVEYTENMYDFDFSLRAADTAVYSANFVEFSAAKTKPEKFFEDARLEAERMMGFMENMAAELDL